jgi:hypothetical protein
MISTKNGGRNRISTTKNMKTRNKYNQLLIITVSKLLIRTWTLFQSSKNYMKKEQVLFMIHLESKDNKSKYN